MPLDILVAEDDPTTRRMLQMLLERRGYRVTLACDGLEAWDVLRQARTPYVAVVDWMMPAMDGLQLCRAVRSLVDPPPIYVILCTTRDAKEDVVAGLESGANDYLTKPFDHRELVARIGVGASFVDLQLKLAERVSELQRALNDVRQLQGLLPICSYCKKIRDDQNYWTQLEQYVGEHAAVKFSHGICPDCYEQVVKPQLDALDSDPNLPAG